MSKSLFIIFLSLFLLFNILPVKAEEEVLILLDSSVSMLEEIDGTPKYIMAIDAAKDVLSRTNPSKKIGLRIIGMQLNSNIFKYIQNPDNLCKASEIINPIMRNNLSSITESLDSIIPLGTTPLTFSLATAITNDFSNKAYPKHIILISDGAESCDKDPCAYIREITTYRKDIKIDIIAINVKPEDFIQLKCLSDASSGDIKPVTTPSEMQAAFSAFFPEIKYNFEKTNILNSKPGVVYKNFMFETTQ